MIRVVASLFLSLVLLPSPSFAQSEIGVASAAKNNVTAALNGRTRALTAGTRIYANEVVSTGEQSVAQLLFLDETSLSIGPRSDVTLDRFIYDPGRGTGRMVLSTSRGALRFVSGSMQSHSYQIRTPVATLGVRGTVFDLLVTRNAAGQIVTVLILVEGATVADFGGARYSLSKPGQTLMFGPRGVRQVSYDGTLAAVQNRVPFPLFGNTLAGTQRIDELIDRLDQLHGSGHRPPPPIPN